MSLFYPAYIYKHAYTHARRRIHTHAHTHTMQTQIPVPWAPCKASSPCHCCAEPEAPHSFLGGCSSGTQSQKGRAGTWAGPHPQRRPTHDRCQWGKNSSHFAWYKDVWQFTVSELTLSLSSKSVRQTMRDGNPGDWFCKKCAAYSKKLWGFAT